MSKFYTDKVIIRTFYQSLNNGFNVVDSWTSDIISIPGLRKRLPHKLLVWKCRKV